MRIEGGVSMLSKVSSITTSPARGGLSSLGVELRAPMVAPSLDILPSRPSLKSFVPYSVPGQNFGRGGERSDFGINPVQSMPRIDTKGLGITGGEAVKAAESILFPVNKPKTPVPDVFQAAFAKEEPKKDKKIDVTPINQVAEIPYRSRRIEQAELMLMAARTILPLPSEIALLPDVNKAVKDRIAIIASIQPKIHAPISAEPAIKSEVASKPMPKSVEVPEVEEELVEELIETQQIVQEAKKDKSHLKESADEAVEKVSFIEAEKITKIRKDAIKEAIKKGGRVGKLIVKYLSESFWLTKSPIVGEEGHDFTIDLTAKDLEAEDREYQSDEEAEAELTPVVDKHIPVQQGEAGKKVTTKEIRKVLVGEKGEVGLEPETIAQIVVKRVLKKVAQVKTTGQVVRLLQEEEQKKTESNLKDLGLEQVYANS